MAVNLMFYCVTVLISLSLSAAVRIEDCGVHIGRHEYRCHEFNENKTLVSVNPEEDADESWTIFCYQGHPQSILFLWVNPVMKVKFESSHPDEFLNVRGGSVQEVNDARKSYNPFYRMLQKFRLLAQRDVEEVSFSAFNQSCVGIETNKNYSVKFFVKNLEPWLLASLGFGIILFLSAKSWSRNTKLHYGTGMSIGVLASILVVAFLMHRVFPQYLRKLGYILMAIGCSTSLWLWTFIGKSLFEPTTSLLFEYWKWIVGYILSTGLISFAVCYRYGPVTEPRTLSLIQWMLQLISLAFMYNGTQIREVSVAVMVTLITLYNLPSGLFDNRVTRYIRYNLFRPKIRLLTEEEFQQQGHEETKKALEELRSFCQSPECNAWKTISCLKSPGRFADFIEGKSWHVTDEELLEYDSGPDPTLSVDTDSEEEEMDTTPDSSQQEAPQQNSQQNSEEEGTTSDHSIEGPPLS